MKVRVLSDLHLEHDEPDTIPHAQADLVVLAGDIHNHGLGLRWAAETFDPQVPVIYVPGNHEYYDGELGALEAAMRDAAATLDNVHFLNNETYVDPAGRFRVLGTTLWADFALFCAGKVEAATREAARDAAIEAAIEAAKRVMLDFRGLIQVSWPASPEATARDFTPADSLALHAHSRTWLEAELARPFAGKTIVVTHHAPHRLSLAARYADDLVSAGFVSDLGALMGAPAVLWVHGHTHTCFDYTVDGTRVVCNPRGYRDRRTGQPENPAFAWDKVVEI